MDRKKTRRQNRQEQTQSAKRNGSISMIYRTYLLIQPDINHWRVWVHDEEGAIGAYCPVPLDEADQKRLNLCIQTLEQIRWGERGRRMVNGFYTDYLGVPVPD